MSFNKAFQRVIKHEGGWVDDSADRGGGTYRGIARNFHPDWHGWTIIDAIENKERGQFFEAVDITPLVEDFYYVKFWQKNRLEEIDSDVVSVLVFDFIVNSGDAVRQIQRVINSLGLRIKVDGIIGSQTIEAINSINPRIFINAVSDARIEYFKRGVKEGWLDERFLKGLVRRAESFKMGKYVID